MNRTARQAGASDPLTVVVHRTLRGRWAVVLPGRRKAITCETLDDARRVAYLSVAHARPCEVIVRDAYHRVLQREPITGRHNPPAGSPPPTMADAPPPVHLHDGRAVTLEPSTPRTDSGR